MEIQHGLSPRRGLTPALIGGLIIVASLGGYWAARAATRGPDSAEMRIVASSAAAAVAAQLDADGHLLVAASEAIEGDPSRSDEQLISGLSRVAPAGRVIAVVRTASTATAPIAVAVPQQDATALVGFDLGKQDDLRLVLDLARDAAGPKVAAGVGPDGRTVIVEALPLYGSLDPPVDVAARRRAVAGYVLMMAPEPTRAGLTSLVSDSELVARIVQGDRVLASSGAAGTEAAPASRVALPVTTNGASWTVEVWSTGATSRLPLVVLFGGLVLTIVVSALAINRERSIQRAVASAESRAQELALVARTGPLLQQSFTVSDLLPVFVVEIGDEFDLESVSISLVSDAGRLVRVFSLGGDSSPLDADPAELVTPREPVERNETFTIPLLRAGRVVGALRARATRGLSMPQIAALDSVCNLLAAALGNARLFQDEQDMVARLRGVDRMKTTFVSSVSHELRTTVTAIDGFAGLLASPLDDERREDYVARIRRNARSLVVLVEDLLDFARFERADMSVGLEPIDLSELVPQVVDQMSSVLGERPVSVAVEPGVVALGDASAIERVLVNLLSNASKYTPHGSAVDVTLERSDGFAALTVSDRGPGIPEDEREKVFELFYRVDDAVTRGTRGIGIGLALTRQLVEKLDGTVTIGDTPGGGASFRVTIPLAEDDKGATWRSAATN